MGGRSGERNAADAEEAARLLSGEKLLVRTAVRGRPAPVPAVASRIGIVLKITESVQRHENRDFGGICAHSIVLFK